MTQYNHVVIDKTGMGLPALRTAVDTNGLQTAQQLGIVLAGGSLQLEHHLHVFMWDETRAGINGRVNIQTAGSCFNVRIRWKRLTLPGIIFNGTLNGDGGHMGAPAGWSTNGAWAYRGGIPRDACFIEGLDDVTTPGFDNWFASNGWSGVLT